MKYQTHKAGYAENAIHIIKRKLYMTLRAELSNDWPHYLQQTIKSLNNRHIASLGGIRPSDIKNVFDGSKILEAQEKKGVKRYREPSWKEQNDQQKKYLEDPSQKFKISDYVYLDLKKTAFDKSYDLQIRKMNKMPIILLKCPLF